MLNDAGKQMQIAATSASFWLAEMISQLNLSIMLTFELEDATGIAICRPQSSALTEYKF